MNVGFRLGGPDVGSVRLLRSWPGGLFFSPIVRNPTPELDAFLCDYLFGNGSLYVEPTEDAGVIIRFREITGMSPDYITPDEIKLHIDYFTARVRNYGHILSMHAGEIRHAVVRGECHDQHFVTVADAASWLGHFVTLSQPEYAQQAFNRNHGFPPFGIGCDCRMEGLIPGTPIYDKLSADRKRWMRNRRFHRLG